MPTLDCLVWIYRSTKNMGRICDLDRLYNRYYSVTKSLDQSRSGSAPLSLGVFVRVSEALGLITGVYQSVIGETQTLGARRVWPPLPPDEGRAAAHVGAVGTYNENGSFWNVLLRAHAREFMQTFAQQMRANAIVAYDRHGQSHLRISEDQVLQFWRQYCACVGLTVTAFHMLGALHAFGPDIVYTERIRQPHAKDDAVVLIE